MPGMLPVLNRECVAQAVRTGLGLKAKINLTSVLSERTTLSRLAAGYQISQFQQPIVGRVLTIVSRTAARRTSGLSASTLNRTRASRSTIRIQAYSST